MTTIHIIGDKFTINGQPTYAGRTCEGLPVEGLLFNVRAVQATFDDANPGTRLCGPIPTPASGTRSAT